MRLTDLSSVWRAPARAGWLCAVVVALAACTPAASAGTPPISATRAPAPSSAAPSTSATSPAAASTTPAAPRSLDVVGLGDSVMSGAACDCTPFITRYATALAARAHTTAHAENLGRSGLTVPGLATQIATSDVRRTLGSASVVVVTIGANDLVPLVGQWQDGSCGDTCVSNAASALAGPLDAVLAQVRAEVPEDALVLVTTYWNVFEDGDVADSEYGPRFAQWSDGVTGSANDEICAAAKTIDATCVDLYTPFNGAGGKNPTPLLADDGDHPDSAGHALIAAALLAATPTVAP